MKFPYFLLFALLSTLLALAIADQIGVCTYAGDPLESVTSRCYNP